MNNRLLLLLVLLLLVLSARAQFSNNGRVTNRANRISERQLSFIVKAKSSYTGFKQATFVHQGPSTRTLVNLGSFTADTNHTDIFQGPGGKSGPQEITGTVRPYFFNLTLQNGANQPLAITNTDGANVRGLATFANGLTTTVRSLTTAGALRFETRARYTGELTDAQHVDGYVSKVGSTSFTFPVGSSSDSRPLTISRPPTATDHYGVAWIEGDPTTTPDPSDASALHPISQFDTQTLTAVSPIGQWDWISLSGTGAGLTIRVLIPDLTSFASSVSLRLVGWNGTKWINLSTGEKPYSAGKSYASFNTDNSTLVGTMVAGITAIGIGRFPSEFQLSGNLFDDGNGLTDGLVNQVGLGPKPVNGTDIDPLRSGSQPLFVSLVGTGSIGPYVLFTEPISTSGTYSFSAVTAGTYSVVLSTNPQGSVTPSLPTSWTATGENLGAGPGSDGLADGILTGVTVATAAVTNANFGIDRLPEGASVVLAAQPNPGGGNRTPIPASAFTATDLEDGTYASNLAGRLVSLRPASGGTLYYQGNPVTATLAISSFDPTQVALDPSSNDATTAGFGYTFYDNAQVSSDPTLNPVYISQPYTGAGISIAGNLFDDGNGLTDNTVNQTGQGPNPLNGTAVPSATGTPTPLFVSLTIEGNVLATVPVSSAGSYSFSSVQGNTAYTLVLTTNPAGSFQSSLPSSWVYTGEFLGAGAGNDFTPDGQLSVSVGSASRTNANFGIDQRPLTQPVTLASQPNPEGSAQAPVSATAFSATDREDGNYPNNLTGRTVSLSAAVGGTLYYSTTAVSTSLTVASFDPAQLTLDPTAPGSTTASFTYAVKDNAGVNSVAATITLSFSPAISLSGNVFDDGNGLSDSQINGPAVNGPALPVYVSLVNETTVVETVPVSVAGFFKFLSIQANKVYKLILSTVASGSQTPSLPTQWVNTGESVPDANKPLSVPGGGSMLRRQQAMGVDAVVDGILLVQVNTTNVDDIRFGIEQRPQVTASVLPLQPNPKANNRAPVYASAFSGSDPEDGTYANNLTGRVVRLSAATGGTLYYQNGPVRADQTILSFDPTQLTLDPMATGATTAIFTYSVKDQAGVESSPQPVTIPFYDEDDQNDDTNDPETKTIKLPEFSFTIIIPPLLLPPIILPPPPIFGILIPSFPTNVSSLTIGTTVYTKDTFPSDGVVVKTDEKGKLIEDVIVDPIQEDQPTGVPFQALGSAGTPISALGVLTINPPTPDVSLVLNASPSTSYGTANASVVINVFELTAVPTQGLITILLTKDPLLRLSFDASQTMVGGRPVQNSVWRVDESQADYYILTTSQPIGAGALLRLGLTGQLSPGATKGVLTISAILVGNSGGEVNIINNSDAETIDYFQR